MSALDMHPSTHTGRRGVLSPATFLFLSGLYELGLWVVSNTQVQTTSSAGWGEEEVVERPEGGKETLSLTPKHDTACLGLWSLLQGVSKLGTLRSYGTLISHLTAAASVSSSTQQGY